MKINKKLLIPVFATAMGLSVIGGVSGAVAWYQYNTKVQASWMGVTTADGGVLQIREKDGEWGRFANFKKSETADFELHPVTFGGMTATSALPGQAYKHPEAGVADMESWDPADEGVDYYQFTFELRALKLNASTGAYDAITAKVYLDELVLESATENKTDVGEAVRIHIAAGSSNKLYSKSGGNTVTHGNLDLDRDDSQAADEIGGYAWNYDDDAIDYGDNGTQVSTALAASSENELFNVPAAGLEVTVTVWLEGWHLLRNSAIWDATKDAGASIHFGMKLSTPKDTFLAD